MALIANHSELAQVMRYAGAAINATLT